MSEYDDKPQERKQIESHSFERLKNISVSKYLDQNKQHKRYMSQSKKVPVKINNALKVRKTKKLTQTKLKNLLNNNPNKLKGMNKNKILKCKCSHPNFSYDLKSTSKLIFVL